MDPGFNALPGVARLKRPGELPGLLVSHYPALDNRKTRIRILVTQTVSVIRSEHLHQKHGSDAIVEMRIARG